jgi:hypothetical protein
MSNLKSISIPEPCHQSWQQMTPENNGRHCAQCSKIVTDFTVMSTGDIINYLGTHTNTCGRFEKHQVNSINTQLYIEDMPLKGRLKGWLMTIGMLLSTASFKVVAQTGAPVAQTIADSQRVKCDVPMLGKVMAIQYREITGQVVDSGDNSPLPGAVIFVDNNTGTTADQNGNFKLRVPLSATKFTVKFIGYSAQVINIDQSKMAYNVHIKQSEMLLGDIVIIKQPFYKRMYYRFIKNPIRKLFKAI